MAGLKVNSYPDLQGEFINLMTKFSAAEPIMNQYGYAWDLPSPPFTLAIPSTDGNVKYGDLRLLYIPRSSSLSDQINTVIIAYVSAAGEMRTGWKSTLHGVSEGLVSPG